MPASWHPVPLSLKPLQLYRHLLREASYLPPAFRKVVDSTIQKRFHDHKRKDALLTKRLAKAKSSLRMLRAANSGDKDAMQNLVMKGFGRTGLRRRDLMSEFVRPQGPGDSEALESLLAESPVSSTAQETPTQETPTQETPAQETPAQETPAQETPAQEKARSSKNAFFEKWDTPKLLKLLHSMKQQQGATKSSTSWHKGTLKAINPEQFVPETNIWGKPPAACVVTAKRAHWWRRMAEKMMPPLGKGEWELLEQLSQGRQDAGEWAIPSRRPLALTRQSKGMSKSKAGTSNHWDWEAYIARPTANVERQRSRALRRRSGLQGSGPYAGHELSKEVSGRWFRRVYNRAWQISSKMEQDPNTLNYKFEWGRAMPKLPSAIPLQMQIFEGVDERGNLTCEKPDAAPSTPRREPATRT
ncbi:hypothetical protein E4U31_000003 [Claviceps sp. LM219 group G6]|nr:hypothetical protein E4U14_002075 [Claviceps sp. LM454 group G7]KAG6114853.1 hypothetical protein E4U31_000003 [Claviceps sp. LM219 group G6]